MTMTLIYQHAYVKRDNGINDEEQIMPAIESKVVPHSH